MHAIEFESEVQGQTIPLPKPGVLRSGQAVRVVVMFEETSVTNTQQPGEDLRSAAHPVAIVEDRLASLVPHPDAISDLCDHPLVLPDFLPLSRDEAHER